MKKGSNTYYMARERVAILLVFILMIWVLPVFSATATTSEWENEREMAVNESKDISQQEDAETLESNTEMESDSDSQEAHQQDSPDEIDEYEQQDVDGDQSEAQPECDCGAETDLTDARDENSLDEITHAESCPLYDNVEEWADESAPLVGPSLTGAISGFLWAEGSDSPLPNGWNGLNNNGHKPLAGYTVSLYAPHDLNRTLAETRTDANGQYIFAGLQPGQYILGVASATINGTEYLPPMAKTAENKFSVNRGGNPMKAYTSVIELTEGDDVENINAGMRPRMGLTPMETGTYKIIVHNVDTNDDPLGAPNFASYSVTVGNAFSLPSSRVPSIDGYVYTQWKKGLSDAPHDDGFPSLTVAEVTSDMEIYLIYKRATVDVTVNMTDKTTGLSLLPSDVYTVYHGDDFLLNEYPTIQDYDFTNEWSEGSSAASIQALPISLSNVTSDIDVYIYYEPQKTVDIIITNTVIDEYGDRDKDFRFIIDFQSSDSAKPMETGKTFVVHSDIIPGTGASIPTYSTLTLDAEATLTFDLKHGQRITIKDVPSHWMIKIRGIGNSSYRTSFTDNNGGTSKNNMDYISVDTEDGARTFSFVNKRILVVPASFLGEIWAAETLLLFMVLAILASWLVIKIRKRRA